MFGGPGAWDNADKTAAQCPATGCDGAEAAFYQIQIRSADEPMTSFFKVGTITSCSPCGIRTEVVVIILLTRVFFFLSFSPAVHDVWTPLAGELVNFLGPMAIRQRFTTRGRGEDLLCEAFYGVRVGGT